MSFDASDKRNTLQRYHDGELDPQSVHELERLLARDSELKDELERLEKLREGLRRDSETALEAFHEPNFTANLMQRLDAEPVSGWSRLRVALNLKGLVAAGGLVGLTLVAMAIFGGDFGDKRPAIGENPNDCVVDRIENVRSTSVVFETKSDEEPVTVIWVYE